MIRRTLLLAVLFSLAPAAVFAAHPDHEHRITGTVVSVSAQQIEVKDGNEVIAIRISDETKVGRGRKRASLADIQIGENVAVDVTSEDPPFTAKEIVLEEPKKPKKK